MKPDDIKSQLLELNVFDLPDDIPQEAGATLGLWKYHLSTREISEKLGITEDTVRRYVKKYKGKLDDSSSKNMRKNLLASQYESISMQLLSSLTKDDVNKASPAFMKKLKVSMDCVKIIGELKNVKVKPTKTREDIVDELKEK